MTMATLSGMFPVVARFRRTWSDSHEMVYVMGASVSSLTVLITHLARNTVQVTTVQVLVVSGDWCAWADVSPSVMAMRAQGTLLSYEVRMMNGSSVADSITYTVERENYAQHTELCWLNRYGAYETLHLTGRKLWKAERSAEHGWSGDEYVALDMEVADTYESNTGYCSQEVMGQVRDLMDAPLEWVLMADGSWRKVTVTAVPFEQASPTNEARQATVTWRYAERDF